MTAFRGLPILMACAVLPGAAWAGPPYATDDAEPTEYGHYEIYLFGGGTDTRGGKGGAGGIDFNYGAAPGLQLTAVVPAAYDRPAAGSAAIGLGNVELAAKIRFLRQVEVGWDVAIFPRVFLPSPSSRVAETHAAFLLPLWVQRDWGKWSTFGGGGCVLHRGGDAKDFCLVGWALTRQVSPDLQLGAEVVHETANSKGGKDSTGLGFGVRYDLSDTFHLLGSVGPGLQNAAETDRFTWYASILFTF